MRSCFFYLGRIGFDIKKTEKWKKQTCAKTILSKVIKFNFEAK